MLLGHSIVVERAWDASVGGSEVEFCESSSRGYSRVVVAMVALPALGILVVAATLAVCNVANPTHQESNAK